MAEDKRIEKMAECCPYFWNGGCTVDASNPTDCDLMCEMFGFMTNLVRADFFNREWISVEERLPEDADERVLVYIVSERSYTELDTDRFVGGRWVRWGDEVTHWMPLPQPPEPKGETE